MHGYSLSHVADHVLLRNLRALVARESATTAEVLAHLAEVDARQLYLPAAYPSMYAYCVGEFRLSEDMACKRIRAARVAREFPTTFPAVADGRLSLGAVLLLAPRLTAENADTLLAAASNKSRAEIEALLAERFPRKDVPSLVEPLGPPPTLAVTSEAPRPAAEPSAPGRMSDGTIPARVAPLAPERYSLQLTIGREFHDKLRHAQQLLSHVVHRGDVAEVLERGLDELIEKWAKRKCGAAARRGPRRASRSARHIPAHVREAVWRRDGGQCTFLSEGGRRCEARERIEYDHVVPVVRGGEATVEGTRLLCRSHNQFAAEQVFGPGFMEGKREESRQATAAKRAGRADRTAAAGRDRVADERDPDTSVIPWLRGLGLRTDQARRAAADIEHLHEASLEERVKAALAAYARARFPSARRTAQGALRAT